MKNPIVSRLWPVLTAAALAFTPSGRTATPHPTVVSPGGKGTYLTGENVNVAGDGKGEFVLLPFDGKWPWIAPTSPQPYIGKAAKRAPVTNRWWSTLNLSFYGQQLQERDAHGALVTKSEVDPISGQTRQVPVWISGEEDFSQYVIASPLQFLARRDGLAFSYPSAFAVARGANQNLEALGADGIRPSQSPDLAGLAQVIVSSTAVPNRRSLGTEWKTTGQRFTKFNVSNFSDWWVETTFDTGNGHQMVTTLGAGSPMWYASFTKGDLGQVSVNNLGVREVSNNGSTLILEVTYNVPADRTYEGGTIPESGLVKQLYAFFGEPGSTWVKKPADEVRDVNNATVMYTNEFADGAPNRETHMAAAVIAHAALAPIFAEHAMSPVVNSQVTPHLDKSTGTVTVEFKVEAPVLSSLPDKKGCKPGAILSLFPHQYMVGLGDDYEFQLTGGRWIHNPNNPSEIATVPSLLGPLQLMAGSSFEQKFVVPKVQRALAPSKEGHWSNTQSPERKMLERLLNPKAIAENDQVGNLLLGNYEGGKRMAKYANAAAIAGAVGSSHKTELLAVADKFLTGSYSKSPDGSAWGWFVATDPQGKPKNKNGAGTDMSSGVFWYDQTWKSLLSYPAGYGSAEYLNDHHFIYGYFIRTAVELAHHNREWLKNWGPMVNLLVDDVLTFQRDTGAPQSGSLQFPFLRNFDPWYGRSWATGVSNIPGDGPDQESTSEAVNAWSSVLMWARETHNSALENWSSFLLASELRAARCYWFDVTGKVWRQRLPSFASIPNFGICFAGKLTLVNWFNPNPSTRLGIQLLPMTGVSIYHGAYPDAVAQTLDRWFTLQGIKDFTKIEQWKQGDEKEYVYWCDVFWDYMALSSNPAHVAFAKKVITPSAPEEHDSLLEDWPLAQVPAASNVRAFNQFDQGDSKANVYWFISNAKANLNGHTVSPKDES